MAVAKQCTVSRLLLSLGPLSRQEMSKRLGGDTLRTADSNWPRRTFRIIKLRFFNVSIVFQSFLGKKLRKSVLFPVNS